MEPHLTNIKKGKVKIERENHNRKNRFLPEKTRVQEKITRRREDALVFKKRIIVLLLQVIGSSIISPSLLVEEKGYFYKLKDDVEVVNISGGCIRTIFMVVIL